MKLFFRGRMIESQMRRMQRLPSDQVRTHRAIEMIAEHGMPDVR